MSLVYFAPVTFFLILVKLDRSLFMFCGCWAFGEEDSALFSALLLLLLGRLACLWSADFAVWVASWADVLASITSLTERKTPRVFLEASDLCQNMNKWRVEVLFFCFFFGFYFLKLGVILEVWYSGIFECWKHFRRLKFVSAGVTWAGAGAWLGDVLIC